VAGWLTNSCVLGGQFCTESACVLGANEDVRVCCWLSLDDEASSYGIICALFRCAEVLA